MRQASGDADVNAGNSRRAVLASLSVGVATSGCLSSLRESVGMSDGCDDGASRIRTEPLTNERHKEYADPIRVESVPAAERELLERAIEDGEYLECGLGSTELQSLIERIENHRVVRDETALYYAVDGDDWYELDAYRRDEHLTTE